MPTDLFSKAAKATGLSRTDVARIVKTGTRRYKVFAIPKRSGGLRTIAQPARELKKLQHFLMEELLSEFPLHDACMAYREGRSIRDNAQVHVENDVILKMDFLNFFGSITPRDFDRLCADNGVALSAADRDFCRQVIFWRPRGQANLKLSIGAPSSPMVSNAVMYSFDQQISDLAQNYGVAYSRYADDLTFSCKTSDPLLQIRDHLPALLRDLRYPVVFVNPDKTTLVRKKHRRTITGLVIANEGFVSLGRNRKRRIRAAVHYFLNDRLDEDESDSLRGELAFAKSAEPEFIDRLRAHYGADNIERIFKRRFRTKA